MDKKSNPKSKSKLICWKNRLESRFSNQKSIGIAIFKSKITKIRVKSNRKSRFQSIFSSKSIWRFDLKSGSRLESNRSQKKFLKIANRIAILAIRFEGIDFKIDLLYRSDIKANSWSIQTETFNKATKFQDSSEF